MKRAFPKIYTATVYGCDASSRHSMTDAKQQAIARIEAAMEGDYRPSLIEYRGCIGLVWRDLDGWGYRILWPDRPTESVEELYSTTLGCVAREEAQRRMLQHLAQCTWTHEDDTDYLPPFLSDPAEIREFQRDVAFQRRYRRAVTAGLSDVDAHRWAGNDPAYRLPPEVVAILAVSGEPIPA